MAHGVTVHMDKDSFPTFLLSLETADDRLRTTIMRSHPNKVAYKWVEICDLNMIKAVKY
jgi:hypothetical protein